MPKPVEPLSDTLYDMNSLNRLFFVSSLLLIGITVWAAWQDYDRNWKHYQRDFRELALEKAKKEQETVLAGLRAASGPRLDELYAGMKKADEDLKAKEQEIEAVRKEREANRGPLEKALLTFQFEKSEADTLKQRAESAQEHLDEAVRVAARLKAAGDAGAGAVEASIEGLKKHSQDASSRWREKQDLTDAARLAWEVLDARERAFVARLEEFNAAREAISKEIAKLENDLTAVKRKVAKLEPSLADFLLSQPGLDFIKNPEHINQIILPHFQEDLNFSSVMKIDRCTTCHLGIDRKGWGEEVPKVFRSHPNLDLYVGDASPHPMSQYGCTVCHNGQGRSVDFAHAAHMPRDEAQQKEWEGKYGWHPPAHFDNPMLPIQYVQSSCTKCHGEQTRVVMGDKVNEGKRLLEKVGCYGCHPIAGTDDLRKPGPGLRGIKHKMTKEFAFNWIWKPTDFRPTTHMPQIFDLSNTSDDVSRVRNTAMIRGIVEYLYENSELEGLPDGYPKAPEGDAKEGRKLARQVGCYGCHVIGDPAKVMADKGTEYTSFGPNLSAVGSKLNANWLYAWLKNPAQYFHYASMPNLRLSDQEAADITAYLMTLKHPDGFENRKMEDVSDKDLDDTCAGFMRATKTKAETEELLKKLTHREKLLWLGEKAIGHTGCFGCHDIRKFEKTKKIGAELTGSNSTGTKDITKFDFGFRHDLRMSHHPNSVDRIKWVKAKLEDPRTYDHGRIIGFEDRLRMPKFNLTPEEIEALTTYVISFRREMLPESHKRKLSHQEKVIERGKHLAQQSNCAACHKVGLFPTTYRIEASDEAMLELADAQVYLARTVLTDGRQVDRISADELAILAKKGIVVLLPRGTWLTITERNKLLGNTLNGVPRPVASVLVYGFGEGAIKKVVNKNDEDRFEPPIIAGVGARDNPDWLFRFLKAPVEIRPYLREGGVRMPTFGFTDEEARTLVEHFAHIDNQPFPFVYDEPIPEAARVEMVKKGKAVFERLQCASCHPIGDPGQKFSGLVAPDLTLAAPRLQRDWVLDWIRKPNAIFPGSGMSDWSPEQVSDEELVWVREYIWSLKKK
ncbi:MAG: c-type cytochrome [Candidatus Brocadiae bacterium]|nr:c-type cytochrome [Candidatus Brocadiia bacterium]